MASNSQIASDCDNALKDLEQLIRDSAVGDTMYEKKSVIENVLKVGKHFQHTPYIIEDQVIELNTEVEELMCTLWDISVEEDVSAFYLEHGVLDIFVELFSNPNNRVKEISIGVMANMAFHAKIFLKIMEKSKYLERCIKLLEEKDSPTLEIVFRCLHTFGFNLFNLHTSDECTISKEEVKHHIHNWLVFLSLEDVVQNIGLVIASCTNSEVLANAAKFLSILSELWEVCDERQKVTQFYADEQFLTCLLEAVQESIGKDKTERHFAVFLNIVYEHDVDKEIIGVLSSKVIGIADKLISNHVLEYTNLEETDLEFIFNLSYLIKVSLSSGGSEIIPNNLKCHLKSVQHRVESSDIDKSNENAKSVLNLIKNSLLNLESLQEHENGNVDSNSASSADNSPLILDHS